MKRAIICVVAALITLYPAVSNAGASGSAFGGLMTAQSIGMGNASLSAGVGIAEATSFLGSITYGLSKYTDGRIKLALYDRGGNTDVKLAIGADIKWQFWSMGTATGHPFDFATGGLFEFVDFGDKSVLQVGGQLIGSIPVGLQGGGTLTPYGRFTARMERIKSDNPVSGVSSSDSNLEIGFNGGAMWKIGSTMSLFGEFQLDGNDGVFFGIDFGIM